MKKDRNIILRIQGSALLTIFLLLFAGNNFFHHAHQVDDRIIVHSHPFKSDSQGNPVHKHPATDYLLIHLFNTIVFCFIFSITRAGTVSGPAYTIVPHYRNPFFSLISFLPLKFRGPPPLRLL
ncbi:MAG TPA: hypothetical protein PLO24_09750 [Bacteroidales bacterium]|jgi:hypothetical protein|nr:hypothetical protein [Bacteroidales bacterium]HOS73354.1 hypothetical protein [Bacteroidales bacterium]HQH25119.1 hypothetical protein [Bacteroidales bacterium]HQJ83201.1 hypothetical protein [Bacteroidales bacterium]